MKLILSDLSAALITRYQPPAFYGDIKHEFNILEEEWGVRPENPSKTINDKFQYKLDHRCIAGVWCHIGY